MKAKILGNDFNRIMDATKQFCGTSTRHKEQEYIRLDFDAEIQRVTAHACDGYRLSVEHSVIGSCDENFTVYIRGGFRLPKKQYATIEKVENEVQIRCAGALFGFEQPDVSQRFEWQKVIPKDKPAFRIGFNGNYLLNALQAAKVSAGQTFKNPIVLEFWTPTTPVIIRTNTADIKMVLPIRIKE
jgi:hypothetical protein|nr:MAG TPA: DNA polymerase III subunit beta [Caudoviricetes sp.]